MVGIPIKAAQAGETLDTSLCEIEIRVKLVSIAAESNSLIVDHFVDTDGVIIDIAEIRLGFFVNEFKSNRMRRLQMSNQGRDARFDFKHLAFKSTLSQLFHV